MWSYLKWLFKHQLKRGHVGLKAFVLANDNIRCIMIKKGALAVYSEAEMLLRAIPRELKSIAVLQLELVPRDPLMFTFDTLRKHILDKCFTADGLAQLDMGGTHMAPGVSCDSIPAGLCLPQMPVMVDHQVIPNKENLAPTQVLDEIPIRIAENIINTKMDNMMKAFEARTFQLSKANELRYRGYQTARAYTVDADHPPPHTPMNFSPASAPMGPTYYRQGSNYQQYPWQGLGPCIYCDELGQICMICPNVHTNKEEGIVNLNDCGKWTLGSKREHGGEISGYQPEITFCPRGIMPGKYLDKGSSEGD